MRQAAAPHLLVMTATIKPPPGVITSDRNDPAQRLDDYAQALEFYLSDRCRLIDRIVFIDNSLADLAPLRQLADRYNARENQTQPDGQHQGQRDGAKRVEFVSFYGLDYPPGYTKGYGECKLLDYGFQHSRMLGELGPLDKWWKITGRYRVTNLDNLIRTAPRDYDLYADFRPRKERVDVRVMSFSQRGYEQLCLGRYPEMAGIQLEEWFYHQFAPLLDGQDKSELVIVPEYYYVPRVEGIGGYKNINYMTGKYRIVYHARATLQFFKNLVRPAP